MRKCTSARSMRTISCSGGQLDPPEGPPGPRPKAGPAHPRTRPRAHPAQGPSPAQGPALPARPPTRPHQVRNFEIQRFWNLGIWKFGIPKKQNMNVLKIRIRSAQNVGKVWISRKTSSRAPFGAIPGHFLHGPKKIQKMHVFAYVPWWMPYFPWWAY